ncbi:unnamed protein product [Wuchereria bancrofti]|uniref:Uncharacterized protein n=1 Tax=Wuchereria bancrofti TaxID=6293 RepID=A0A3P7G090_WUCBA|nr:unnamed protein product [Wuchereria bancrofti]
MYELRWCNNLCEQALVPYANGADSFSQRAGSEIGVVCGDSSGETPCPGMLAINFLLTTLENYWRIKIIFVNYTTKYDLVKFRKIFKILN